MVDFRNAGFGAVRPRPNRFEATQLLIPQGGVNTNVALSRMPPEFMPYAFNIYSSEQGLFTRPGYREWATGHGAAVRTIIPVHGNDESGSGDFLFSVTPNGIYDISTSTASPTLEVAFGVTSGRSGWGQYAHYTNDAGARRVLYADGENGLHTFDGAGTWALETGVTGLTEADVRYVLVHKLRVWLAVKNSAKAWYLPVGAYTGAATEFNFASQFPNGGYIRGMWNWTVDGGSGSDDLLVVLSSSGDVLVYEGEDPSSATTWTIRGKWNIGQVPAGRNLGISIGGELHLLSAYGPVSMNDLLRGIDLTKLTGQTSIARNIVQAIRYDMVSRRDSEGWNWLTNLTDGYTMLTRPIVSTADTPLQYVFNLATNAWGMFRDVPMQCGGEWNGTFYFGDQDGVVHFFTESLDGVARDGSGGSAVEFSFCTAFNNMGSPAVWKIGDVVRPTFLVPDGVLPNYTAAIVYDYNLQEISNINPIVATSADAWDVGEWDQAIWGGVTAVGFVTRGASGMGRTLAVAIKGEANYRTRLIDIEVMWHGGGPL